MAKKMKKKVGKVAVKKRVKGPVKKAVRKVKKAKKTASIGNACKSAIRKKKRVQKIPKVKLPKTAGIKGVATIICVHLTDMGFDPVLTGKACAAIHAGSDVDAKSLEFVISEYVVDRVESVMASLGFKCLVHRTFGGKGSKFEVSFLPPPVAVGDAVVENIYRLKGAKGELKMLNPTDCIRQRLSMYYRFGSESAFLDALAVARKHKVDMEFIARWSDWEWAGDKFETFMKSLKS